MTILCSDIWCVHMRGIKLCLTLPSCSRCSVIIAIYICIANETNWTIGSGQGCITIVRSALFIMGEIFNLGTWNQIETEC